MKKVLMSLAIAVICTLGLSAQEMSPNALGLKLGGSTGNISGVDVEFSYQKALSSNNRLELDLGFSSGDGYNGFSLSGYYQWVWNIQGGFNWYAAPGASVGYLNFKNADDYVSVGVAGQVGIEYRFSEIPLQLTLDYNPYIGFTNSEGYSGSFCLGIRYMF